MKKEFCVAHVYIHMGKPKTTFLAKNAQGKIFYTENMNSPCVIWFDRLEEAKSARLTFAECVAFRYRKGAF